MAEPLDRAQTASVVPKGICISIRNVFLESLFKRSFIYIISRFRYSGMIYNLDGPCSHPPFEVFSP